MKTLNETEVKHSPTPWSFKWADDGVVSFRISAEGLIIADVWFGNLYLGAPITPPENVARANAQHIVKCVNLHDDLLDLAKQIVLAHDSGEFDPKGIPLDFLNSAKSAIARAEGRSA